jgi:hypothetical protein
MGTGNADVRMESYPANVLVLVTLRGGILHIEAFSDMTTCMWKRSARPKDVKRRHRGDDML